MKKCRNPGNEWRKYVNTLRNCVYTLKYCVYTLRNYISQIKKCRNSCNGWKNTCVLECFSILRLSSQSGSGTGVAFRQKTGF